MKLNINNTGTRTISTNPRYWEFIADGITYQVDKATLDPKISTPVVNVGLGGKIKVRFVYLIHNVDTNKIYKLKYNGPLY